MSSSVAIGGYNRKWIFKHGTMEDKFEEIENFFNIKTLKKFQKDAIFQLHEGNDIFLCAATGGGKSLVYQSFAMKKDCIVVIFTPLVAIMKEQVSYKMMQYYQNISEMFSWLGCYVLYFHTIIK